MRSLIWWAALGVGLAIPIGAIWYGIHRRRRKEFGDVTPRWLNENVYDREGDRRWNGK